MTLQLAGIEKDSIFVCYDMLESIIIDGKYLVKLPYQFVHKARGLDVTDGHAFIAVAGFMYNSMSIDDKLDQFSEYFQGKPGIHSLENMIRFRRTGEGKIVPAVQCFIYGHVDEHGAMLYVDNRITGYKSRPKRYGMGSGFRKIIRQQFYDGYEDARGKSKVGQLLWDTMGCAINECLINFDTLYLQGRTLAKLSSEGYEILKERHKIVLEPSVKQ